MEKIKQAVERAKASATGEPLRPMTATWPDGSATSRSRRTTEPDAEIGADR